MGPQAVLDDFLFPSATRVTLTLEMLGAMRGDMANNPSMMDPLSSLTAALQPCSPPGNDNHQSLQYGIDVPSSSAKARMPGCKPPNTVFIEFLQGVSCLPGCRDLQCEARPNLDVGSLCSLFVRVRADIYLWLTSLTMFEREKVSCYFERSLTFGTKKWSSPSECNPRWCRCRLPWVGSTMQDLVFVVKADWQIAFLCEGWTTSTFVLGFSALKLEFHLALCRLGLHDIWIPSWCNAHYTRIQVASFGTGDII